MAFKGINIVYWDSLMMAMIESTFYFFGCYLLWKTVEDGLIAYLSLTKPPVGMVDGATIGVRDEGSVPTAFPIAAPKPLSSSGPIQELV